MDDAEQAAIPRPKRGAPAWRFVEIAEFARGIDMVA